MSTYETDFPQTASNAADNLKSKTEQFQADLQERGQQIKNRGQQLVKDADTYVRENPIPVVIGALAVGFVFGLLARGASEPERPYNKWAHRLEDSEDHIRSLADAIVKSARKNYKKSSSAMKSVVDDAVSAVKSVDTDDVVDPVTGFFKRLFR